MEQQTTGNGNGTKRHVRTTQELLQSECLKNAGRAASACRELLAAGHSPPPDVSDTATQFTAAVSNWISEGM